MTDTTLDFQTLAKDPGARDGQVRLRSFPLQPKAIHDEMSASYDREYGRMSGNLGLEGPNKTAVGQQLMLYPYVNPPDYYGTPAIEAKYPFNGMTSLEPLATLDDGTQIWKITHNGVDTHPIHFHLFDIQLVNRVGWDNIIRKPEPSELGWKDTVRVSPLEDTIVALRPILPKIPWGVPDSKRPLDPSMALGTNAQFNQVGADGNQVSTPIVNEIFNFKWEYVWHCHILSHEEMDMMRPYAVNAPNLDPLAPTSPSWWVDASGIQVRWGDATPVTPGVNDPGSGWGVWSAEYQFVLQYAPAADPTTWTDAGTGLANATSATLTPGPVTAANQGSYVFRVVARNAMGDAPSAAVAPSIPPSIPAGLTATAVPVAPADTTASVQLSWTASTPDPANGYAVQRATDAAFTAGVTDVGTTIDPTVTLTDSGLPFGSTVYYRVRGTTTGAAVSGWSEAVGVTTGLPAPTSALLAPASVTAVSGASAPPSVTVTWTPVAGATGYEVVRSDGTVFNASALTWTASATGSATSATDPTPLANTAYTYAVRATATVSGFPMMSAYTAAPSVVTIPSAPALQPVAQGGAQDALVVSWTAPSGQLSPVTGYVLERSLTGTGGWTSVPTTGTATSVTDTGLAFLTTYHYRVATVTAVGQSDWSAIQSGTTGLSAPAAASATASTTGAEVTVTWTAVPTVTAYEVARSDGASFVPPGTSLTTTAAGLSFVDPTVAFGSTYTYAVRALVGPTSSGWATTNPVTTIPTAPSGLVVTATATSVNATANLAWTADPAATGYVVQRSTDAAFTAPVAVTAIDMATASDLGLAFVTTYYYRVAAVNPTGQSAWSASSSVTTPLGQPSAFTATDTASPPVSVTLSWSGNPSTASYEVRRSVGATFTEAGSALVYAGLDTTTTDVGAAAGTAYTYAVRGLTTGGAVQSAWTTVGVTTLPDAPTGVTAVATSGSVTVSWTASAAAGVTYAVERSTAVDFSANAVAVAAAVSGTSVIDPVSDIATYYYRVRASNTEGTSAWSATAAASTTLTAPASLSTSVSTAWPLVVTLTWPAVPGATGYEVQRSTSAAFVTTTSVATSGSSTSTTDTTAAPTTTYYYRVRATASAGTSVSGWTNAAAAVTTPSTAIVRVTGLALQIAPTGASPTVNATWTAQPWAATYTVQFARDSAFTLGLVTRSVTSAATSYDGLTVGVRYYVRVRAEQPTVVTTWSSTASITVSPPNRPASLTASLLSAAAGTADVRLTWTPGTTAPISGYVLQRATDSAFATAVTLGPIGPGVTTYDDAGLARNVRYYWRIAAVSSAGQSTWRTVRVRRGPRHPARAVSSAGQSTWRTVNYRTPV